MQNYVSLAKPLSGFVKALQVLSEEYITTDFLPCEVLGLCFYEAEVITFLIKLSDGEVFSYIPPTAIQISTNPSKEKECFSIEDLCFMNSPSDDVRVSYIKTLEGTVSVFIKSKNLWLSAEYICTIDFPKENELLNLVKFDNGFLGFIPFHKMKFKELSQIEKAFIPYKKQRETYKI